MKKTILIGISLIVALTAEFIAGFYFGEKLAREEANKRAVEMILNDEIPNYYLEVGTVDYLINNKSGELQKELKKAQYHEEN